SRVVWRSASTNDSTVASGNSNFGFFIVSQLLQRDHTARAKVLGRVENSTFVAEFSQSAPQSPHPVLYGRDAILRMRRMPAVAVAIHGLAQTGVLYQLSF